MIVDCHLFALYTTMAIELRQLNVTKRGRILFFEMRPLFVTFSGGSMIIVDCHFFSYKIHRVILIYTTKYPHIRNKRRKL